MVTGIVKGEDATGWCAGEVCGSMWGCKFDGVFFSISRTWMDSGKREPCNNKLQINL